MSEQNHLMLEDVTINVNNITKESIDALMQILSQQPASIQSKYNFNIPPMKPSNTTFNKKNDNFEMNDNNMAIIEVNDPNGKSKLKLFVPESFTFNENKTFSERMKTDNETFAENYIKMLGIKEELLQADKNQQTKNAIASFLFRCMLSMVLGYLYQNAVDIFNSNFYNQPLSKEDAEEFSAKFILSQIDQGIIQEGNWTAIGEQTKFIDELLQKPNVLNPKIKNLLGVENSYTEDHYETIIDLIVRIAYSPVWEFKEGVPHFYANILKSVCVAIINILEKYALIEINIENGIETVKPYFEAIYNLSAYDVTFTDRLKSIFILTVAYNSYGWIFFLIAPFMVPAAISVTTWSVGLIARLPFKILGTASRFGLKFLKFITDYTDKIIKPTVEDPNADSSLILVGYIEKQFGENETRHIPYMISKGDIQKLSQFIQDFDPLKPSLIASILDGHGVFDLGDWQKPGSLKEFQEMFSESNPVSNLLKCVDAELKEITNNQVGEVLTLEEIVFSLFVDAVCDPSSQKDYTLRPLMQMWKESIFLLIDEKFDGTLLQAIVNPESFAQFNPNAESSISSVSSVSTISSISSDNFASFASSSSSFSSVNLSDNGNTILIELEEKIKTMQTIRNKIRERMPTGMAPEKPPDLERELSLGSTVSESSNRSSISSLSSLSSLSFGSFESDEGLFMLFEKYNLGDFNKVKAIDKGIFSKEIAELRESQSRNMALLDKLLEEQKEGVKTGYIIVDAMDSFVNWVINQKGGYKGSALGKYLTLMAKAKPRSKLIKSVTKFIKRKRRITKKLNNKRRGTKKVYRKRRISHKKQRK